MAFASLGNLFNAQTHAPSFGVFNPVTTRAVAVGDFLIAIIGMDNVVATTDVESSEVISVAIGTNSFTKAVEYCNGSPGASAGAIVSIWYCVATATASSGATATVTTSTTTTTASVTIVGQSFSRDTSKTPAIVTGTKATGEAKSITSGTIASGKAVLLIRGLAIEDNENAIDGATASWTLIADSAAFTTGGGATANIAGGGEFRIMTGAAAGVTSNPTGTSSGDMASAIIAFEEVTTVTTIAVTTRTLNNVPIAITKNATKKVAIIAAPTTWNPSDKAADMVLTNANLTATYTWNVGNGALRSTNFVPTGGKAYWEATVTTYTTGQYRIGFINQAASLILSLGGDGNGFSVATTGTVRQNGANIGTVSAFVQGDVVCLAYDRPNGKVWFRTNGGLWNNSGTADPATNVGGITVTDISDAYPAWSLGGGSAGLVAAATANFGASAFSFAVPSGFTAINNLLSGGRLSNNVQDAVAKLASVKAVVNGTMAYVGQATILNKLKNVATVSATVTFVGQAVIKNGQTKIPVGYSPVTWDPANMSITTAGGAGSVSLSGGNLTANFSCTVAAGTSANFKAIKAVPSGTKAYYELTIGTISGNTTSIVALCNALFNVVTDDSNGSVNGLRWRPPTGIISYNGTTIATVEPLTTGNTVSVAIDDAARLFWVKRNAGNWNNNVSANPATGVGGIAIPFTGLVFPLCSQFANAVLSNTQVANFGASAFTYAIPSGFEALSNLYVGNVTYAGQSAAPKTTTIKAVLNATMAYVPQSVAKNAKKLAAVLNGVMQYLWQTSLVNAKKLVAVANGLVQYIPQPITMSGTKRIAVTPATMTYSGQLATLNAKRNITAGIGTMSYTGMPVTRNAKKNVAVTFGIMSYVPQTVLRAARVTLSNGLLNYVGKLATITAPRTVPVVKVNVNYVGQPAFRSVRVTVANGLMMYLWQPSNVNAKKVIAVGVRTLNYVGQPIAANTTTGHNVSAAIVNYAGQVTSVNSKKLVGVTATVLLYSGKLTNVNGKRLVPVAFGTMTYSGQIVLRAAKKIVVAGIMSYVGQSITRNARKSVTVAAGNMAYLGQPITTNLPTHIVIKATMTYTGQFIGVTGSGGPALQHYGDPLKIMYGMGSRS